MVEDNHAVGLESVKSLRACSTSTWSEAERESG